MQYAGHGYVDSGGVRYYQAATSVLETGMINLTNPDLRKALVGLLCRTVKGSRGIVSVTVTRLDGTRRASRSAKSQFYDSVERRLNLLLGKTTAIRLKRSRDPSAPSKRLDHPRCVPRCGSRREVDL